LETEEEQQEEDDTDEEDDDAWLDLLHDAVKELKADEQVESAEELLQKPGFSLLLEALRKEHNDIVHTFTHLKQTPIRRALENTNTKLRSKGMKKGEAEEATWDKKKHLSKVFVKKHMAEAIDAWNEEDQ